MNSKSKIPNGYAFGDYMVLVPEELAAMPPPAIAARIGAQQAPDTDVQAAVEIGSSPPRKRVRTQPSVQVYCEQDLQEMESSMQSLSRSNDRRKNCDSMLTLLRRTQPLGMRRLVKVPRGFGKALDELEEQMPNFRQVIGTVRRMLSLQVAGDGSFQLPPMLLAGDPGVGKTYFAMRLAKLLGAGFDMISMEGATSPMSLIGLEQHYYTSSPGKVFDLLVRGDTANPVFVVDELDKASSEARHPPANALYQLLEVETAKRFCDQSCLQVRLDASRINWIVTANYLSLIPVPILSRLNTFFVPNPTGAERIKIAGTIYQDLRRQTSWGRRFEPSLPLRTAKALAGAAGSVRPMKSLLRLAFANAYLRKSRVVDPTDVSQALRVSFPLPDLERMDVAGHA